MKDQASTARYPTFYVDDSLCEIGGKKHVILAAVAFADEEKAVADWLDEKRKHGLHPYAEVKWNDRSIPLDQRREFVRLLNNGIGIAVVDDSSKQNSR